MAWLPLALPPQKKAGVGKVEVILFGGAVAAWESSRVVAPGHCLGVCGVNERGQHLVSILV